MHRALGALTFFFFFFFYYYLFLLMWDLVFTMRDIWIFNVFVGNIIVKDTKRCQSVELQGSLQSP